MCTFVGFKYISNFTPQTLYMRMVSCLINSSSRMKHVVSNRFLPKGLAALNLVNTQTRFPYEC